MVFDPLQPFEDVTEQAGFDPSADFDVLNPEGIRAYAPSQEPLEREMRPRPATPRGPGVSFGDIPESGEAYQKRQMEHYGMKATPSDTGSSPDRSKRHTELQKWLGYTPGRPEDMQKVVKRIHGPNAELIYHEGTGDYAIQFRDTGETVPFNAPGLQTQDIKGLQAPATQVLGEVGAGLVGLAAGPKGAFAGVGAGAGATSYANLKVGSERKLHDLSEGDMLAYAAKDAAWAMVAELTVPIAGRIIRRIIAAPGARRFIGEITEEEIEAAAQKAVDMANKVEARGGVRPDFTAGQAAQMVAPEAGRRIRTAEALVESRTGPSGFQEIRASQEKAESALGEAIFGKTPERMEGIEDFGFEVQRAARQELILAQETIGRESIEQQAEAMARQGELTEVPPSLTSAEDLRKVLSVSRDTTFDAFYARYDELWSEVPDDVAVNMGPLRKVGSDWASRLDEDIFKSLTPEDRQIVKDALKAGVETTTTKPVELVSATIPGKTVSKEVPVGIPQVSRALSVLKQELRFLDKAPAKAKARDKKPLIDFVKELQGARDKALADLDPKLAERIGDLDAAYAVAKQRIDESLINRMISKKSGGGFRIADDKLFDTLLRNPSEMRNINSLVKDPEYKGFVDTSTLKQGIVGKYRDKVLDGTMTHNSFMSQYGPAMREVFERKEMRRFDSLEKAGQMIKSAEKREKAMISDLNRTFDMKLTGYEAEEVFDAVSKTPGKIARFRQIAPDRWDDFKALYGRDLLNKIQVADDVGEMQISPAKLNDTIAADRGMIKAVYGEQAYADMKLLADLSQMRRMPKSVSSQLSELNREQPELTAPMALWRALVARPLSRMGLLTTSALKMSRREARTGLKRVMTDPELLHKSLDLYRKADSPQQLATMLEQVGMVELARSIRESEE